MALSLAAAALGSAVIGGAASAYGASQSKKAANKALEAQNAASQQQLAAQQAALDKIIGLNQPVITGGQGAYAALLQQFGITASTAPAATAAPMAALSYDAAGNVNRTPVAAPVAAPGAPPSAAPQPAPAPPVEAPATMSAPTGQPDYAAYGAANADLQAEWQRIVQTGNASAFGNDPNAYYASHWQKNGQAEGRTMPGLTAAPAPVAAQPPPTAQTPPPAAADPNAAPDYLNAARPGAQAPPTSFGEAPNQSDYFSNFEADPGAAYRRSEALSGVNAASAARGKLRSGDATKALATLSSDLASQEYNNWFNRSNTQFNNANNQFNNQRAYDTSLWQYGTDRGDQNFNADRSFQQQQDNTRIGNMFDLAKMGTAAAGNVSGATSANANNQSSIFGSQAQSASDAAYAKANANSGLAGNLAGTATNLFANWGGGGGSTNASQPFNQTGFNAWAQGNW